MSGERRKRAEEFAGFMLRSGIFKTDKIYTLKSGRKSPYFLNMNPQDGAMLKGFGQAYAGLLSSELRYDPEKLVLFGPAYKGIPLVAAVAAELANIGQNVRFAYNRKEVKDHGEGGELSGAKIKDGDQVVIIEDVTTSGKSIREVVPLIKAAAPNANLLAVVTAVDRMEVGENGQRASSEIEEEFGCRYLCIANVREIYQYLFDHGRDLPSEEAETAAYMMEYFRQYAPDAL